MQIDPARAGDVSDRRGRFVLYLEGPADRAILQAWCRRLEPQLVSRLSKCSVILGGRRPARALEHFESLGEGSGARGLCVLDRDDGLAPDTRPVPGLDFFVWSRRHIESYLLVPGAILRGARLSEADGRLLRQLRDQLPPERDEAAYRELDAKRMLAAGGPLARTLGAPVAAARVARATREAELHPDVHAFFGRLRREMGVVDTTVVR